MTPSLDKTSFSSAFSAALRRRALPQSDLAKIVGCTPQYISQLKNGERPPSREMLERIARALNMSPTDLDPHSRRSLVRHFEMMQGIDVEYLAAAMRALRAARTSLLAQTPPTSLLPGAGKSDAMVVDAVTEQAIASELEAFNSRCMIITEEKGILGKKELPADACYVVDPFDRSRPFFRAVKGMLEKEQYQTLADIVSDPDFGMRSLEAPSGSITCVRDDEIIFNAMMDYASGSLYVACKGFVGYGDIDECPDPRALAERGTEITFSKRPGTNFLCFISDPDKEKEMASSEKSSKYRAILLGLRLGGLKLASDPDRPLENPGGPMRILYLSDLNENPDDPSLILSNGEKIFEFLGWLAFAIHSQELAVYELYSDGFEARDLILHSPPPNYSAFVPKGSGFRLDLERIVELDPPGHYRGAIVVTHSHSTVACATMRAMPNCRELYHPFRNG